MLDCCPISKLPWNCPVPFSPIAVASGKFHIRCSRSPDCGSEPMYVLMLRVLP